VQVVSVAGSLTGAAGVLLQPAESIELTGVRALQYTGRVGQVDLGPVTLRVERISDTLVEQIANASQVMRGVIGAGKRGAIRPGDAELIPGRIVSENGRARARRGRDGDRQQS